MYGFALETAGFRWADAVSGHDAITQARLERPALILMDLSMPRLDGWEAIGQLQADEATRRIPFIILTGDDSPDTRERAKTAGAAGFLVKPVLPDVLEGEVKRVLSGANHPLDR